MAKRSVRFDKFVKIQENKPKKVGIETVDNWVDLGTARKCWFKFDSGSAYNTQFADRVLLSATLRIQPDPRITEKMRVILLGNDGGEFKIISAMPAIVSGRKMTEIKVQRWADL